MKRKENVRRARDEPNIYSFLLIPEAYVRSERTDSLTSRHIPSTSGLSLIDFFFLQPSYCKLLHVIPNLLSCFVSISLIRLK